jgi:hypothetical protein
MSDPDRLDEIKRRATDIRKIRPFKVDPVNTLVTQDVPFLLAEVERLRGLLKRLEWAGGLTHGYPDEDCCPACAWRPMDGHDPDCWLAAALGREER